MTVTEGLQTDFHARDKLPGVGAAVVDEWVGAAKAGLLPGLLAERHGLLLSLIEGEGQRVKVDDNSRPSVGRNMEFGKRTGKLSGDGEIEHTSLGSTVADWWALAFQTRNTRGNYSQFSFLVFGKIRTNRFRGCDEIRRGQEVRIWNCRCETEKLCWSFAHTSMRCAE